MKNSLSQDIWILADTWSKSLFGRAFFRPKENLYWMLLTTWPRKTSGSLLNVRMHAISCQLRTFYDFTSKWGAGPQMKPLIFHVESFLVSLCLFHFMYQWTYPLSQESFRQRLSQGTFLVFIFFLLLLFWVEFSFTMHINSCLPVKCKNTIFIWISLWTIDLSLLSALDGKQKK